MDPATFWPLVSALLHVAVQVALGLRVLFRRQPLANTHAWLLLVFFVPVVGIVLYVLIGENRLGAYRVRNYEKSRREVEPHAARLWARSEQDWGLHATRFKQLASLGNNICNTPAVVGNDLHLLTGADETLDAMIADIEAARSHVHLLTYIFQPFGKPTQLAEALCRAAERGVEVRVAVDGAGSRGFLRSHVRRRLESAGVEVVELLRVNPIRLLFRRLDLRNHRKILVIDGEIAYCGSHNITDDDFRPHGLEGPGPWHDASVRLQGDAAVALGLMFAADWNSEAKRPIEELERYMPPSGAVGDPDGVTAAVQLLPSGPGSAPQAIQSAFVATMYAAYEELIVTTPYFVPDVTITTALATAAGRGVDVTLILPRRNNAWLVDHAGKASFEQLLDAGVKIRLYRPGLLHAKTVTVDREVALIGSANIDQRSFWINFEITLAIFDTDFASHMRMLQQHYIDQSDRVDLFAWRRRPLGERFAESFAKLFSPLL